MKKIVITVHKIIALVSSVTIMIALITGAILIFEKELTALVHPERYALSESESGTSLEYATLITRLQSQTGETITELTLRPGERDTWLAQTRESPEVKYYFNPSSGEIVDRFVYEETFFYQVLAIHRWLMVYSTGKIIMGISCILFTFILLSGLWLWLPANHKGIRARLSFKRNAGEKRKLFDKHVVLGFYILPVLLLMSITGPTWSFPWYRSFLLRTLQAEGTYTNKSKEKIDFQGEHYMFTSDEWNKLLQSVYKLPPFESVSLRLPDNSFSSYPLITLQMNPQHAISHKVKLEYQYDVAKHQLTKQEQWGDLNRTTRLRYWFYALHVGSFAGLWSKWIYFLVCLAAATLPVTGYMWWRNKVNTKYR